MSTKRKREEQTDLSQDKKIKVKAGVLPEKGNQTGKSCLFNNTKIFVIDAGLGKTRAEMFRKQLSKQGAEICKTYSDLCTHVIVDASVTPSRICALLGIDKPPDIFSTKVVQSSWVSECLKGKQILDVSDYLVDFSGFNKTGSASVECGSKEDKLNEDLNMPSTSGGQSHVTSGDKDANDTEKKLPKVGVMWRGSKKSTGAAVESGSDYSASDDDDISLPPAEETEFSTQKNTKIRAESWICAHSSAKQRENHNKHITDKLQELAAVYESSNDRWRALGYQKAIAALKRQPKPITTFEEAKSLMGVGARLAEKIWEIVESGELRKLNELSGQEEIKALKLFTGLWGAGPTTARTWVQAGFRTLQDIREKAHLTRQQQIGLKYYDDILDRMPRSEAAEIEAVVIEAAHSVNPGLICMACGSYRRGKPTCGDVDVLITHPDGKSHRGIFHKVLNKLRDSGFLTDDLVTQEESGNQKKYLGVCLLPKENAKHRRLDIIVVPYDEFACALMYFTGSAHFNRSMRHLAGKMGMSLSEHSLNKGVVRRNGEKINTGTVLPTLTEEDVFKHLGLKYRPPEERDH